MNPCLAWWAIRPEAVCGSRLPPAFIFRFAFRRKGCCLRGAVETSGRPACEMKAAAIPRNRSFSLRESTRWIDAVAGYGFGAALGDDGEIYVWGRNQNGQLGTKTPATSNVPRKVPRPDDVSSWSALAAGRNHMLAIDDQCRLHGWGSNAKGELAAPPVDILPPATLPGLGDLCAALLYLPPAILTPPEDRTALAGDSVTWTVLAEGHPPLGFRWAFNNVPISGATNSTLALTNLQPAQAGTYSVIVSNEAGTAASSAVLQLRQPPVVSILRPMDGSVFVAPLPLTFALDARTEGSISQFEIRSDTNLFAQLTDSPWLVVTHLEPGDYEFTATATDELGATGTSASVRVSVLSHLPMERIVALDQTSTPDPQTGRFIEILRISNPTPFPIARLDRSGCGQCGTGCARRKRHGGERGPPLHDPRCPSGIGSSCRSHD
jgi:hypothetical protein